MVCQAFFLTNNPNGSECNKYSAKLVIIRIVPNRKEEIVITKKGKPMALLLPVKGNNKHLSKAKGWLEEGDPFFKIIESIIKNRNAHTPRLLEKRRTK